MAHLLVVESWVGSMSRLLPRALGEGGHHFTFLTRDLQHYLRSAPEGTESVEGAAGVLGTQLAQPGRKVEAVDSNNAYLGHVMAGDAAGPGARDRVESLLACLRPRLVRS